MQDNKEHLKIDLEFLDKKDSVRGKPITASGGSSPLNTNKYNWRKVLFISGIILFFGWAIFSDSGSSSPTSTSNSSYSQPATSGGTVRNGQYSCSRYDSDQADSLDPTESEQQVTLAQNLLQQRANELDRLKNEIDDSSVNDYSPQYVIDDYNEQVDTYNSKLTSYKRDASSMSSRIDQYNAQVERRNNYLIANCTRSY